MENESSLSPYTSEEITDGERLPDRISSIKHDIETGERLKLDVVIKQAKEVAESIQGATKKRFVFLGSMGMYLTLNKLRENGKELMLLEQRISGGKNDFDVGVHEGELKTTMDDFSWDDESSQLQRGKVGNGDQMIDIMARNELPSFPWCQVEIEGTKCLVQTPEEMIFEKIDALVNPRADDEGQPRKPEVKWGVDIKILKTYLMMENDWSKEQLEEHLSKRWGDYSDDVRYQGLSELASKVGQGKSAKEVLAEKLGKETVDDVGKELIDLLGTGNEKVVERLFHLPQRRNLWLMQRRVLTLKKGLN